MSIKAIKTGHLNHAIALAVYGFLSFVLVDHGVSITRSLSGQGSDPYAFLWFLAWWPHAVMAHLSPIVTTLVWYPIGVSLAWLTAVPALSFIFAPLTALAGPVVSYNVLVILSPILCAWFAYLVCFHLTEDFAASLVGGFLLASQVTKLDKIPLPLI